MTETEGGSLHHNTPFSTANGNGKEKEHPTDDPKKKKKLTDSAAGWLEEKAGMLQQKIQMEQQNAELLKETTQLKEQNTKLLNDKKKTTKDTAQLVKYKKKLEDDLRATKKSLESIKGKLDSITGDTDTQVQLSKRIQANFEMLRTKLVDDLFAEDAIDDDTMQHIVRNMFKCAKGDFEHKLKTFHHVHSHNGSIKDYESIGREIECIFFPAADSDGGMFSPSSSNFKSAWCTEFFDASDKKMYQKLSTESQDTIEMLARKLVTLLAQISVSHPQIHIDTRIISKDSLQETFNKLKHQIVLSDSKKKGPHVPNVRVIFPMLCSGSSTVLVKASVVCV